MPILCHAERTNASGSFMDVGRDHNHYNIFHLTVPSPSTGEANQDAMLGPSLQRFVAQTPRKSASDVYSTLLLQEGEGFPLWLPSPGERGDPENGINIGDVGIITPNGAFYFLFNICRSRHDIVNSRGVLDGFPDDGPLVNEAELMEDDHPQYYQMRECLARDADRSVICLWPDCAFSDC